jgi:nucleoside permease NupC
MHRYSGILGIIIFLFIAYLLSDNRKKIPYKTVIFGLITQVAIAVFMLKTPIGVGIFNAVNKFFVNLLGYSDKGAKFLFGSLVPTQKPVVSRLAIKALIAGFLATMMTAAITSLLLTTDVPTAGFLSVLSTASTAGH